MYVNEEGAMTCEINDEASKICGRPIFGNVVVVG